MIEIEGKYTTAKVFSNDIEDYCKAQVKLICDQKCMEGNEVVMMPDCHPGKMGPVGLTIKINNGIVIPKLLGTDLGCGVTAVKTKSKRIEFQQLDRIIRECIPSGAEKRKEPLNILSQDSELFNCRATLDYDGIMRSFITLGGGNHFIEIDKGEDGYLWVVVHSGSRSMGRMIYDYYDRLAEKTCEEDTYFKYLSGQDALDYADDVLYAVEFAWHNRINIINIIMRNMKMKKFGNYTNGSIIDSAHNYISYDMNENINILRKGTIRADKDENVIIPINMKDGIIIGTSKGNSEWNYSAPHGSGRVASREQILNSHTVSEYKKEMKGIYSSVICKETLDEAPFAYRDLENIKSQIGDTVEIKEILKPVYNFKAKGEY